MTTQATQAEILVRAMRAFFIAASKDGAVTDQPSNSLSEVEELQGKTHVVLRNTTGILAVYRVRNDGMLKRLRRWPAELTK